jgi:2-haloacid dehalogenase
MDIKRSGSQPSAKAPTEYYTGETRIDPLFEAPDPASVQSISVTFEPGARTAWHAHPLGQTLIVTAGCGYAQSWNGPVEEIRPGDVIWFRPGEKQWHGAAPTTAMTHIAIQERLDGKVITWMEQVSDAQYRGLDGRSAPLADSATKPLIVFDVNETLLDLESVAPLLEQILGDKDAVRLWFANLVVYAEALTLAKAYVAYDAIGAGVLEMLARTRGISLSSEQKRAVAEAFASMPPYQEVPACLKRLRDAGFRLFTLTNNTHDVQTRQLDRGGILQYFERCFSIEAVQRDKPAPEAYAYVESELGVEPSDILLVACHVWDTLGAVAAGWHAALIERPGNALLPVGPQPDFSASNLTDVVEKLVAAPVP